MDFSFNQINTEMLQMLKQNVSLSVILVSLRYITIVRETIRFPLKLHDANLTLTGHREKETAIKDLCSSASLMFPAVSVACKKLTDVTAAYRGALWGGSLGEPRFVCVLA